ncbi:sensor histidine kinase [Actinokineospora sp. HUAS TT18]|uniref:sensor histidine kinase n=1 Tax=Actinokineospora sp. HUAS TT18 TaxID=3447451 RepID=UPI003F524512
MRRREILVAVAVGAIVLGVTTIVARHQPAARPLDALGYAWLLAGVVPLLWRTRFPLAAFVVSAAAVWAYFRSGYPGGPLIIAPTIALFTLTTLAGPATAAVAAAIGLCVAVGVDLTLFSDVRSLWLTAWLVGVIGAGAAVRSRQAQRQEHARRLEEQARLRVARDVHDVVAHSLAMINVQAGVGAHVADRRPEEAKQALLAIRDASRDALAELRQTLDLLRSGDLSSADPGGRDLVGLARVPDLARGGLRLAIEGDPGPLPAEVDATAFRLVQEGVTNAVRHAADATTITVTYERQEDSLALTITDDGRAPETVVEGNGLRGMRERVETLGGTFTVDPGPTIRATLPVP